MADHAVALDPPIVVVGGGSNDFAEFVRDPMGVVNSIYDTMGTLRTGLPTARIIAAGPSPAGDVRPFVAEYEMVVRDAVTAVRGEFVSLTDPDVIDENMPKANGVHVDSCHTAIASGFACAETAVARGAGPSGLAYRYVANVTNEIGGTG